MAKITLNKLNLEKNTKLNTFVFNEQEVEVSTYLPIKDKIDLIDIVIQESMLDGKVCRMKVDALLHLYIVYCYSNISFSQKQKEEYLETYDLLEKNGFIAEIISALPKNEYSDLVEKCYEEVDLVERYNQSVVGLAKNFIEKLPETIAGLNESLDGLDENKIIGLLDVVKEHGAN